ncbi:hypothetical protein EVAR_17464_1 [Eumeta japonica]|uniref:Uncharacterized protein n=1 Tax=Eumeta variegata TaxID=151549 RepID=A0A4C1V9Y6_EUMVA|nr:hypothetical protein EVAR_17464_1 [Eumeta japonica]
MKSPYNQREKAQTDQIIKNWQTVLPILNITHLHGVDAMSAPAFRKPHFRARRVPEPPSIRGNGALRTCNTTRNSK